MLDSGRSISPRLEMDRLSRLLADDLFQALRGQISRRHADSLPVSSTGYPGSVGWLRRQVNRSCREIDGESNDAGNKEQEQPNGVESDHAGVQMTGRLPA